MKKLLALFADWANGLFALGVAGYITDTEIVWWYIPLALLCSHLPDIDAVPELLRRGKVAASAEHPKDHRTFLHYPLLAVPFAGLFVYLFGFWGWLIGISVILHLVNDLYGTGWGLPLLWPFSKTHYKVLGRRVNWSKEDLVTQGCWDVLPEHERKLRFVVWWSEKELPDYIRKWGVDNWIGGIYLKINWISGIEYTLFAVACVLMTFLIL